MITLPPEKIGSFYLGAKYDQNTREISNETINYDARDLTTHAVCVGMTGSGKTGLCIGLLEEAAIDKVPAIIIDPKGDMTNLLLQFENLEAADFVPWINVDDASRKGMSVEDYASATADKWKAGLAEWGQSKERIQLLKNTVDYTVYTPGSDAGIPVNILGSFAAPKIDFETEAEMLRERIQAMVAALLGMINSKEDPVRSREGILLANIFEHYWKQGQDLDLANLIRAIQKPPITQLGVFDIETFYPEKERFELAMDFNNLMASPQFSTWLKGDPLDIDKIYFTAEGKPRHSIFYIAHLSDSERMFFVTLLLNSLISWMRRQSGTTSLRSLLYFDEIFGYFPPTAQPPSKKPLLTILKQARAYGLGAVLVTQNPMDIDYKGLSNAGTWFIGKLQTERDKDRVLEGLEGAIAEAGNATPTDFSQIISSLSSRVFLMHNVHEAQPVIYHTRWAMSYLRGPMTRPQLKKLMASKKAAPKKAPEKNTPVVANSMAPVQAAPTAPVVEEVAAVPPAIDPAIQQRFLVVWKTALEAERALRTQEAINTLIYEPAILATGSVRFYNSKRSIDQVKEVAYIVPPPDEFGRSDWTAAYSLNDWQRALQQEPDHPTNTQVQYGSIPDSMNTVKELSKLEKEFSNWLYQKQAIVVHEHDKLDLYQGDGESLEAFQMRVAQAAKEIRDEELDELKDKYEKKLDKVKDKIRDTEQDMVEAEAEKKDRKRAEWLSMAETVFSVFVKRRSRSVSGNMTKSRMRRKAAQKLEATQDELEDLQEDFQELEEELKEKLAEIREKWEEIANGITHMEVKPRRTDIKVNNIILTWEPYWVTPSGQRISAIEFR